MEKQQLGQKCRGVTKVCRFMGGQVSGRMCGLIFSLKCEDTLEIGLNCQGEYSTDEWETINGSHQTTTKPITFVCYIKV